MNEEEARNWMECPEDFNDITWSESMIEELELQEGNLFSNYWED